MQQADLELFNQIADTLFSVETPGQASLPPAKAQSPGKNTPPRQLFTAHNLAALSGHWCPLRKGRRLARRLYKGHRNFKPRLFPESR